MKTNIITLLATFAVASILFLIISTITPALCIASAIIVTLLMGYHKAIVSKRVGIIGALIVTVSFISIQGLTFVTALQIALISIIVYNLYTKYILKRKHA